MSATQLRVMAVGAVVALAVASFSFGMAVAGQRGGPPGGGGMGPVFGPTPDWGHMADDTAAHLKRALVLDDAQASKARVILETAMTEAFPAEQEERRQAVFARARQQLNDLLTERQRARLDELRRRRPPPGRGPPDGPPPDRRGPDNRPPPPRDHDGPRPPRDHDWAPRDDKP